MPIEPRPDPAIDRWLDERTAAGDVPGGVYAVDDPSGLIAFGARGLRALLPAPESATPDTIYDLASLTKPMVTAALAALFSREDPGFLDAPIGRWIPELGGADRKSLTMRQLGTHCSGLPAWAPFYVTGEGMAAAVRAIGSLDPVAAPGEVAVYSDPGFILLGEAVARAGPDPLDARFRRLIAEPAGLADTQYCPGPDLAWRIAPTERDCLTEHAMVKERGLKYDGWRKGIIRGEVHDGNARGLGGVAGHAGLFGTAADLVRFGREVLGRGSGVFSENDRELFRRPGPARDGERRTFGWQLAATAGSAAHGALPDEAIGHTGFTGTSLWLDSAESRVYVLLTNRIHPVAKFSEMNTLRREFHRLAAGCRPQR